MHPLAMLLNGLNANRCGQVLLAVARPANEYRVVCLLRELAAVEFSHQQLVHVGLGKRKAGQVPVRSKPNGALSDKPSSARNALPIRSGSAGA